MMCLTALNVRRQCIAVTCRIVHDSTILWLHAILSATEEKGSLKVWSAAADENHPPSRHISSEPADLSSTTFTDNTQQQHTCKIWYWPACKQLAFSSHHGSMKAGCVLKLYRLTAHWYRLYLWSDRLTRTSNNDDNSCDEMRLSALSFFGYVSASLGADVGFLCWARRRRRTVSRLFIWYIIR